MSQYQKENPSPNTCHTCALSYFGNPELVEKKIQQPNAKDLEHKTKYNSQIYESM